MTVTNEQLLIDISVDTADSKKALDEVIKQLNELNKVAKSTDKGVNGFEAQMVKLAAAGFAVKTAFEFVIGPVKKAVEEFQHAKDGQIALVNVLKLTNDNIRGSFDELKNFAEQMQETTQVSDDTALGLLSTAKAMGLTNEAAKRLVLTSANLAARNKEDVHTSFEKLTSLYRGNARALGPLAGLVGDLTEKQLVQGKGLERLSGIFSGQATASLEEFSGSMSQIINFTSDLLEAIGDVISEIFNIDQQSKGFAATIKALTKTVSENRDSLIAAGKSVVSVFDDIGNVVSGIVAFVAMAFGSIITSVLKTTTGIVTALNAIGLASDETQQSMYNLATAWDQSTTDMTRTGIEAFKAIGDTSDSALEGMQKQFDATAGAAEKGSGALKRFGKDVKEALKDAEKATEDLKKKIQDLEQKKAGVGANEGDVIRQKAAADRAEIQALQDKIGLANQFFGKNVELVNQARTLVDETKEKELGILRKKNLDDLISANKTLALDVEKDNLTIQDMLQKQVDIEKENLRIKASKLELDDAGRKALEDQIDLLQQKADIEKKKAPSAQYQGLEKAGKDIATNISSVMTSGALDMVGGMASGVGAIIDAVDALLDLIPNMLNKIAGIFDKLTAFPQAIVNGVKNIAKAINSFISDFIPNLITGIADLIETLISGFVEGMPRAFQTLLDKLPIVIQGFVDRLPDFAERLVTGLITFTPKLMMSWVTFLVREAPRIAISMIKVFYVELPKAIVKGVIEAAKQLFSMLKGLFGLFKPKLDTKSLTDAAKNIGRTLTGASEKLFAVKDLELTAKAQGQAAAITDATNNALNDLKALWDKLLGALKDVWMFVWEKVIQPLLDGLKAVWDVIVSVLTAAWNGIMAVFTAVWDTITVAFTGVVEILRSVWDAAIVAFQGLLTVLQAVWDGVVAVVGALWNSLKAIWDTIFGIFTGKISLLEGVGRLWESILSVARTAFEAVFGVFRAIGTAVTDNLRAVFAIFKTYGEAIGNLLTSAFNVFSTIGTAVASTFKAAISGLTGLGDKFKTTISNAFSDAVASLYKFGGDFDRGVRNMFNDIFSGIKNVFKPIVEFFDNFEISIPGVSGGGGGGTLGSLAKKIEFSQGGFIYADAGKYIQSLARGTDTQMTMTTPGEYIVRAPSVSKIGVGAMNALNNTGKLPGGGGVTVNQTNNLNVSTTQPIDENLIRTKIWPKTKEFLKRATLDGEKIVFDEGVRR